MLWTNSRGVDKDFRTLLHDQASLLKVYLVKDTTDHRIKLEEVISSYRYECPSVYSPEELGGIEA